MVVNAGGQQEGTCEPRHRLKSRGTRQTERTHDWGTAAALLPLSRNRRDLVGSSGRVRDGNQKEPFAESSIGRGALAMLDLPAAHYGGYYEGFANSALWPALHSRADLNPRFRGKITPATAK